MQKINVVLVLGILCLGGCATPAEHFATVAENFGFYPSIIRTSQFDHQVYINTEASINFNKEVLHVYLDGDGTPWLHNRWIASDPTSRNTMILELMEKDNMPAILLGRPCYHGFNTAANCHYQLWTSHRYSRQVVMSLVQALNTWLKKYSYAKVILIGYSGGGTLAVLMTPYIHNVKKIVTLAANLDVEVWSRSHGYKPLQNSLNPAAQPRLNPDIKQIHIVGKKDKVVPPNVVKSYLEKQDETLSLAYEHFSHHCCWVNEWPIILRYVNTK